MNRRKFLAMLSVVTLAITGCLDNSSGDAADEETSTHGEETLGQDDPTTVRLEPEEPYEIHEQDGEVRVILPEQDGRELSFASWAEEIVVAEQVRGYLLDIVERELGVRPESGVTDGIQVGLMEPQEPPASAEALAEFDDTDESRYHLKVRHVTVTGDTDEDYAEPAASYETVLTKMPRSIDVTVAVDEYDDYFTRVPVVCSKEEFDTDT